MDSIVPREASERLRNLIAEIAMLLPDLVALARDLDRIASRDGTVGAVSIGEAADAVVRSLKRH